jgi:hypothetical protein
MIECSMAGLPCLVKRELCLGRFCLRCNLRLVIGSCGCYQYTRAHARSWKKKVHVRFWFLACSLFYTLSLVPRQSGTTRLAKEWRSFTPPSTVVSHFPLIFRLHVSIFLFSRRPSARSAHASDKSIKWHCAFSRTWPGLSSIHFLPWLRRMCGTRYVTADRIAALFAAASCWRASTTRHNSTTTGKVRFVFLVL